MTAARVAPATATARSGVRVVRTPHRHGQAASVLAFLEAGSWFDPVGRSGLAHYYEHGFFAGAGRARTAADTAAAIDDLGATFNAHTRAEYSYFYLSGPYTTGARALDALLTCYRSPRWDPAELAKQRTAIAHELKLFADSPQRQLRQLASVALHGSGPFGLSPLGRPDELTGLGPEDLSWYATRAAGPGRLTVVIDSPEPEDAFDPVLAEHLGSLPPTDLAPTPTVGYGPPVNLHLRVST